MDYLIKQTRSRYSGTRQDNKDESSSRRDGKTPPQRTQSSSERKKSQSWIRRQFSRQMSRDYDFNGSDYPAAVAAAAYAVQSLEESKSKDQKERTYGPDKSLNKMKSKADDTGGPPERLKSALKFPTSSEDPDKELPASTSKKIPEKAPSMKKKISFADIDENRPEKSPIGKVSERAPSMRKPPTFAPTGESTSAPKPGSGNSKADTWEKQEMASIKERSEKLRTTIDNWETKKKKRAKGKLERIEAELDKRRAKAVQSYNRKIQRVEGIAGGARAQAEENHRKEEFKVREKANKIRATGKLPATCLCF